MLSLESAMSPIDEREGSSVPNVTARRAFMLTVSCMLWIGVCLSNPVVAMPGDVDVYGSTTAGLPAPDTAQMVGMEFTTPTLTVAGEFSLAAPSQSVVGISARGEAQVLDMSVDVLGNTVQVTADIDSKLELQRTARLDVGFHGEAAWTSSSVVYESQWSISQGTHAIENHRLQADYVIDRLSLRGELRSSSSAASSGQLVIGSQMDVLDFALEQGPSRLFIDVDSGVDVVAGPQESWKTWLKASGSWLRLSASSMTRLEAHPAGIGNQSLEMALSDIEFPFVASVVRSPVVGTLGLDARLQPTLTAQALAHVETHLPHVDLGSDLVFGFDRYGLRNVAMFWEGEGMWTGEGGGLKASMRTDRTIWSRNSTENASLHLALTASSDPSAVDLATDESRALHGSRFNAMADVRIDATGMHLSIGGSFSFRTRLLGWEGRETADS